MGNDGFGVDALFLDEPLVGGVNILMDFGHGGAPRAGGAVASVVIEQDGIAALVKLLHEGKDFTQILGVSMAEEQGELGGRIFEIDCRDAFVVAGTYFYFIGQGLIAGFARGKNQAIGAEQGVEVEGEVEEERACN